MPEALDAANVVAEARVRMGRNLDMERVYRPRYWGWGFIEEGTRTDRSRHPRDVSLGLVRAYYYWHDVGEPLRAESYINQAASYAAGFPRLAHAFVAPEMAYHLARHKENPQAARVYLDRAAASAKAPQIRRRAEAAILFAEGNLDPALVVTREAKVLLTYSDPEVAILEGEWLDTLMDDIYAKLFPGPS